MPVETHPWGVHRPRVPNRAAMDGIFFVLRTGCQWNALNATGICSSSSAHRRFQEWVQAGVFHQCWALGLETYEELKGWSDPHDAGHGRHNVSVVQTGLKLRRRHVT